MAGLVDYSDSEESATEDAPPIKATPNTAKPTVQKLVDRSNPGKIRVSLPQAASNDEANLDEPPNKRVKTSGGLFGGLASFLPAPKQTAVVGKGALDSKGMKRRGLGAGVNLKTGAEPGFSREPEPEQQYYSHEVSTENEDRGGSGVTGLQLPPPKTADSLPKTEEVNLVGKAWRFKPLSVARKPVKKKKPATSISNTSSTTATTAQAGKLPNENANIQPPKRAKVSLFSYEEKDTTSVPINTSSEYQPLIHKSHTQELETQDDPTPASNYTQPQPAAPQPSTQSLDSIASELNLSAAERRQLFGRQKPGSKNISDIHIPNIINFNTDQEYAHNEELRAKGEEVVHNPVRAIAPGKHSLKQLVNAAQQQKEALEDSFVKGKTNRAEASSRYGW